MLRPAIMLSIVALKLQQAQTWTADKAELKRVQTIPENSAKQRKEALLQQTMSPGLLQQILRPYINQLVAI